FMGWAVTTENNAEAWVEGRRGFTDEESNAGNCLVFNAWSASNDKVNRFLLRAARKVMQDKEAVYFKRFYKDGSVRPGRLQVNDFVDCHIERAEAGLEPAASGRTR